MERGTAVEDGGVPQRRAIVQPHRVARPQAAPEQPHRDPGQWRVDGDPKQRPPASQRKQDVQQGRHTRHPRGGEVSGRNPSTIPSLVCGSCTDSLTHSLTPCPSSSPSLPRLPLLDSLNPTSSTPVCHPTILPSGPSLPFPAPPHPPSTEPRAASRCPTLRVSFRRRPSPPRRVPRVARRRGRSGARRRARARRPDTGTAPCSTAPPRAPAS